MIYIRKLVQLIKVKMTGSDTKTAYILIALDINNMPVEI